MANLVGKEFGYLTVIEKTDKRKNGGVVWLCKCKCGNFKEVTTSDLNAGRVKSCGCYNKEIVSSHYKDLLGQKIGRLTVIEKTDKRTQSRGIIWKCQCECGNICEISGDRLTRKDNRNTKSCGCLQREAAKELGKQKGKNLLGQRFGKLVPIKLLEEKNERIYLCQCDCGNLYKVKSKNLLRGHVNSCGCGIKSKGELLISQILDKYNISYIEQYHTKDCCFKDSNYQAYFDFFVDNHYIIEYDGEQHFMPRKFNGLSDEEAEENYRKTLEHDKYKNQWCKENHIPLIRISYTKYSTLRIEDLKLDTSEFII
jgi:hypothetical protein